jgi:hypothetical protein
MATAKPKETALIVDALTGNSIVVELSAEEIAERETQAAAQVADLEAMATARASVLAKLAELGLTQEEIAAL